MKDHEVDGTLAAIAMVRAFPTGDNKSQERAAFQLVAQRETQQIQLRYGIEDGISGLITGLCRLAAACADIAASKQGRTRGAVLDNLLFSEQVRAGEEEEE